MLVLRRGGGGYNSNTWLIRKSVCKYLSSIWIIMYHTIFHPIYHNNTQQKEDIQIYQWETETEFKIQGPLDLLWLGKKKISKFISKKLQLNSIYRGPYICYDSTEGKYANLSVRNCNWIQNTKALISVMTCQVSRIPMIAMIRVKTIFILLCNPNTFTPQLSL